MTPQALLRVFRSTLEDSCVTFSPHYVTKTQTEQELTKCHYRGFAQQLYQSLTAADHFSSTSANYRELLKCNGWITMVYIFVIVLYHQVMSKWISQDSWHNRIHNKHTKAILNALKYNSLARLATLCIVLLQQLVEDITQFQMVDNYYKECFVF